MGRTRGSFKSGSLNPKYKRGFSINEDGYVRISAGLNRGRYAHIVAVENLLGGPIPLGFEVHHLDWNRAHNCCPHNFLLCPASWNKFMARDTQILRARARRFRDSLALFNSDQFCLGGGR